MTRSIFNPSHMEDDGQQMSCSLPPIFMEVENWSPQEKFAVQQCHFPLPWLWQDFYCSDSLVCFFGMNLDVCGAKMLNQLWSPLLRYLVSPIAIVSLNPYRSSRNCNDKTCPHVTTKAGQIWGTWFFFRDVRSLSDWWNIINILIFTVIPSLKLTVRPWTYTPGILEIPSLENPPFFRGAMCC